METLVFFASCVASPKPQTRRRLILDGAWVHASVVQRMDALPAYRPVNLPKQYQTWPMPVEPVHASAEETEEA